MLIKSGLFHGLRLSVLRTGGSVETARTHTNSISGGLKRDYLMVLQPLLPLPAPSFWLLWPCRKYGMLDLLPLLLVGRHTELTWVGAWLWEWRC